MPPDSCFLLSSTCSLPLATRCSRRSPFPPNSRNAIIDLTSPLPSSIYYLLKTFSTNPFQGQYPNMAVRITTSPIGPRIHRKTPEMKKAMIINTTPMVKRKTPSPFSTFFVFTVVFSSLDLGAIISGVQRTGDNPFCQGYAEFPAYRQTHFKIHIFRFSPSPHLSFFFLPTVYCLLPTDTFS